LDERVVVFLQFFFVTLCVSGLISRAKKVAREVLTDAGAATGAVVGAAEAGTKAAGLGQPTKKISNGKNRSAKQ